MQAKLRKNFAIHKPADDLSVMPAKVAIFNYNNPSSAKLK